LKHNIKKNWNEVVAVVEAGYEREALTKFSSENMQHASKSGGSVEIVDEGHSYSYDYNGNTFSVDKFEVWG
jgi:hypothetical protein